MDSDRKDFLLFNPATGEMRGPLNTSRAQVAFSTEGGTFKVFELDTAIGWRSVETVYEEGRATGFKETYSLDLLRNPLIRQIEAEADAAIAPLLASEARTALYAAKRAEAGNLKGPTPILDGEAAEMGISTKELAAQVIAAANADRPDAIAIGTAEGKRRKKLAAIRDAESVIAIFKAALAE